MREKAKVIFKHKFLWLFWSFLVLATWFIIGQWPQLKDLGKTLMEGQWEWILLAAIIQCFYYFLYSLMVISAFDVVEIKNKFKEILTVTLAGNFVNVVAPVGGAGGAALYVDDAVRRGYPAGKATAGTILALISDYIASAIILVVGLVILSFGNNITPIEELAAFIYFGILIALISLIFLGNSAPKILHLIMDFTERVLNKVANRFKKKPAKAGWANRATMDFVEASKDITKHPYLMLRAVSFGLVGYCLELVGLFAIFHAFHQPVNIQTLVAGYAIAGLFWKVSITPQGIGFVEGAMTLVYTQLGIPLVNATLIALSFRGITFWLPFFTGFLTFRKMRIFNTGKDS